MSTINASVTANPNSASHPTASTATGLATRSERFIGAVVDGVVLLPANLVLGTIIGLVVSFAFSSSPGVVVQLLTSALSVVLLAGVFLLVNGYLLATRGQTIGKWVMKTKIVRDSGEDVPLGELVLKRYVPLWGVLIVPYVGFLAALGNALAIFRENHKCIHDDLAGTKVIKLTTAK